MTTSDKATPAWQIVVVALAVFTLLIFTGSWYLGYYMGVSDTVEGKKGYVCK